MDPHALARNMAHDDLQHPPRSARLCVSGRGKRHLFSDRDGARHLLHHPHRPPPYIPASPRGRIQARTVLPRRRIARVGGEPELYHLDAIRVGDILPADVSARNEGQYELCGRDHGRRRPPGHVRSAPTFFFFFFWSWHLTEPTRSSSGSGIS